MDRGLFMAHQDMTQGILLEQRVVDRQDRSAGIAENDIDALIDHFVTRFARELGKKGINIPVIFLTVNKDFDLAVEVMKLGVEDYLVKEVDCWGSGARTCRFTVVPK